MFISRLDVNGHNRKTTIISATIFPHSQGKKFISNMLLPLVAHRK